MSEATPSSPASVPIVILGAPGSGGDELARVFADGGRTFDGVVASRVNSDMLGLLDRDWTCPPASIYRSPMASDVIGSEVARLQASGPWGVYDPLLLFTLPLWLEHLTAVRLVAATRPHEELVRSLQDDHHFAAATADDLVSAYAHRLDRLRESFDVPAVDMSQPRTEVLGRVEEILRERTVDREPIGAPVAAAALRAAFAEFSDDADRLDRYSGPRASRRRSMVWSGVPQGLATVVELTRSPIPAVAEPASKRGRSLPCHDLDGLYTVARRLTSGVDAMLLPDVASWLGPQALGPALSVLRAHLNLDGMVVVGLSGADAETRRSLGRDVITERDVADCATATSFTILSTRRDTHMVAVSLVALPDAARRAAQEWQAKYERLRRRRSVRVALAVSGLMRPIVRAVRRLRRAGGKRDDGSSGGLQ